MEERKQHRNGYNRVDTFQCSVCLREIFPTYSYLRALNEVLTADCGVVHLILYMYAYKFSMYNFIRVLYFYFADAHTSQYICRDVELCMLRSATVPIGRVVKKKPERNEENFHI